MSNLDTEKLAEENRELIKGNILMLEKNTMILSDLTKIIDKQKTQLNTIAQVLVELIKDVKK